MSLRLDIDRLQRRFLAGDESARADLRQLLQRYIRVITTRALRHPAPRSAIEHRILDVAMLAGFESFLASDQIKRLAFEISDRISEELLDPSRVQPTGGEPGSTTLSPVDETFRASRR